MSKPATFVISLTEAQFNSIMEKAKAAGAGPEALDGGTLPEEEGVQLAYKVGAPVAVPGTDTFTFPVTFTILKKPWIVSVAFVQSKVEQKIQQA